MKIREKDIHIWELEKDGDGAESGILNQLKITKNYHEPSAMLSIEEINMKETSNALTNTNSAISLAGHSWMHNRHV